MDTKEDVYNPNSVINDTVAADHEAHGIVRQSKYIRKKLGLIGTAVEVSGIVWTVRNNIKACDVPDFEFDQ